LKIDVLFEAYRRCVVLVTKKRKKYAGNSVPRLKTYRPSVNISYLCQAE